MTIFGITLSKFIEIRANMPLGYSGLENPDIACEFFYFYLRKSKKVL